MILATQPKLKRQENLRLVPRQDFLSRFQTGLLTLNPPSKIKLRTCTTYNIRPTKTASVFLQTKRKCCGFGRPYRKLVQFLACFLRVGEVLAALFEAALERLSEERTLVFLKLQV